MKDIAKRVGNLKDDALTLLYENSGELMSDMAHVKDKITGRMNTNLCGLSSSIEKNPLKSVACCFGAGVILAMLFLKK